MEELKSIAYYLYMQIISTIFGEIPEAQWYTLHLDAIQSIVAVVLTCIVIIFALAIVLAILRFIGSCADIRR